MDILKKLIPLFAPMLLTGCYEDFIPETATDPVLCLNALITAGEPVEVSVTRTWVFNDQKSWADHAVSDAEVTLYANGVRISDDYLPREGDEIRIVAESNTYGNAEATVTVPKAPSVPEADVRPTLLESWGHDGDGGSQGISFNLHVGLKIDDVNPTDDFYKFEYQSYSPSADDNDPFNPDLPHSSFSPGTFDHDSEPVFKEHIGTFESIMSSDAEGTMFFSDRQFACKSHILNLRFNQGSFSSYKPALYTGATPPGSDTDPYDCGLVLRLSAVSRGYYNHALYVWHRDEGVLVDLGDLGFADPIWGYSNVSTGAGVVAAQSATTLTISLRDFLHDMLKTSGHHK